MKIIFVCHLFMISYTFRRIELWSSTSTLNDKYGEVTVYTGEKAIEHCHTKAMLHKNKVGGSIMRIQDSQVREGRHPAQG